MRNLARRATSCTLRRHLLRITRRQLLALSLTLALVVGVTTFAQTGSGQSVLKHIGVGSEPSRYTELAFVDPAKVPNKLYRSRGQLLVQFTIANHEGRVTTYHWQVVVSQPRPRVATAGQVSLASGAHTYLDPVITVSCSRRTQVTVRLSTGDYIQYWADCVRAR